MSDTYVMTPKEDERLEAKDIVKAIQGIWDVALTARQWNKAVEFIEAYGDQRAADARNPDAAHMTVPTREQEIKNIVKRFSIPGTDEFELLKKALEESWPFAEAIAATEIVRAI